MPSPTSTRKLPSTGCRSGALAAAEAAPGRAEQLVVLVGARRLALALSQVEGVAMAPPLTRVPGAPSALRGLCNLHGSVLPVVDPDPSATGERRHVVVVTGRELGRFALACDWVEELAVDPAGAEPVDADELGRAAIAAFEAADQRLSDVRAPTARIIPRPRNGDPAAPSR